MEHRTCKIFNASGNALPAYESVRAAGMDLRAHLDSPVTLAPGERKLIPTGLFMELPDDCEAQIRPRSGLAAKHGITVLNSPGTIDADYRGEVKVLLINLSQEPFEIQSGERIAQMVQNQSKDTQFIVVSHRRPMIESANRTLGVTQKEKGITKVTGIKLRDEE